MKHQIIVIFLILLLVLLALFVSVFYAGDYEMSILTVIAWMIALLLYKLSKSKIMKHQIIVIFLILILALLVLVANFSVEYSIFIISIPIIAFSLSRFFTQEYRLYLLNFILLFTLLNIGVLLYDQYLDYKLAQFDLDGDTVFSLQEQTPEQQRYMSLWVNDLSRNLMPVTALFISVFSSLLLFFIVKIFSLVRKRVSRD